MSNDQITAEELLKFAPPVDDDETYAESAATAIQLAHGLIGAYCRGRHLNRAGNYRPGVREVALTVAARILSNPGQVSTQVQVGAVNIRKGAGFSGFTIVELAVLNRYRKRAI